MKKTLTGNGLCIKYFIEKDFKTLKLSPCTIADLSAAVLARISSRVIE